MEFKLKFTSEAENNLTNLEQSNPKKHRKVKKTLGLMEIDLHHQSLQTHKYNNLEGPNKEPVFESYVENKTPGAFRVFWYYGPGQKILTILAITPHP